MALLEHPVVFPVVRELLGDDVSMIDNDYFITPPRTKTHAHWHHDVGLAGVYHPRWIMMVKVFYLLTDVKSGAGGTAVVPGSHRYPMEFRLPAVEDPAAMPGHAEMAHPAGTAWLFNGRTYHAALHNASDDARRVLIYNYGHFWMRIWPGYEPSEAGNGAVGGAQTTAGDGSGLHDQPERRARRSGLLKITEVETIHLRLPTITEECNGTQDALLVKICTDSGLVGIGEVELLSPRGSGHLRCAVLAYAGLRTAATAYRRRKRRGIDSGSGR